MTEKERKEILDQLDRRCCDAHSTWHALESLKVRLATDWGLRKYVTDYRKTEQS